MVQRLPIALAQVKAGNKPENLLTEIRQIIYSLYLVYSLNWVIKKLLKKRQYGEFNKSIVQNEYYIYEF